MYSNNVSLFEESLTDLLHDYSSCKSEFSEIAKHHFLAKGKRLRSSLLHSLCTNYISQKDLIQVAASCEMLHEASLIQDDIIDQDAKRRGIESVWHLFGEESALLYSDHLISTSFKIIVDSTLDDDIKIKLINLLSIAISDSASGQKQELTMSIYNENIIESYERIAKLKTGALFALPIQAALILRGEQERTLGNAKLLGEWLGLAYQILNDTKALSNNKCTSIASDIKNQVVTAPVIEALKLNSSEDPHDRLINDQQYKEYVLHQCFFWVARALRKAKNQYKILPEKFENVISEYCDIYFRNKASYDRFKLNAKKYNYDLQNSKSLKQPRGFTLH